MVLIKATFTLLCTFAVHVTAQNRSCGPFDLVSTAGQLFTSDDGYQFPGPGLTTLPGESFFYIDDEGTLTNDKFEPCTFTNAFQCGPHIKADRSFELTAPYGEIKWRGFDIWFVCPPQAVHTTGLPVSTWTATVISSPESYPTEHLPTLVSAAISYIEPWTAIPKLEVGKNPLSDKYYDYCLQVGLQAPWCVPNREDPLKRFPTWRDFPLPTPTSVAHAPSKTVMGKDNDVLETVMDAAAFAEDILIS